MENGCKDEKLLSGPRKVHNFMHFCTGTSKLDCKNQNDYDQENNNEYKRPQPPPEVIFNSQLFTSNITSN